jgi:hypothetical protein
VLKPQDFLSKSTLKAKMTTGPPDASVGHPNIVIGPSTAGNSSANIVNPTTASLNPLEETSQKALADINSTRKFRNAARSNRRLNGDTGILDDEETLSEKQLTDTFTALSRQTDSSALTPGHPPTLTTTPILYQPALLSLSNTAITSMTPPSRDINPASTTANTNDPPASSWTFSAAMVATNTQQTIIHAIPAQLITMFQHRVYVPLSFFLIKSMERIRLERDIKSFKSLTKPIRVIDACNFIDERKVTFMQFNQAYHNFLQCLELCCEPGSGIMEGWKEHFERAV